jgi:hypothetical protein
MFALKIWMAFVIVCVEVQLAVPAGMITVSPSWAACTAL